MKKILLFLIAMLIIPISALAKVDSDDVSYSIKGMYVDATILENGSMEVKEVFILKGSFNGYERELETSNSKTSSYKNMDFEHSTIYNPSGYKLLSVSAKELDDYSSLSINEEFSDFKKVTHNAVGENGYYSISGSSTNMSIRDYYSCSSCTVGFYFNYVVEDVVVLHEDVAELYYQFLGDRFLDNIGDLKINIHLPGYTDEFRVWAHGELTGEIKKNGHDEVILTAPIVRKKEGIDARIVFDLDLINNPGTLNESGVVALDEILSVEKVRAEEANAQRERAKKIVNFIKNVAMGYVISLIVYFVYIYFKYDKEYKSDFDHDINRDFIDDYDVEVIDYLMNKMITPNAMSASIMNLIYKKNISAVKLDDKKDNYLFTLENRDKLSASETKLVNFLFKQIGSNNTFTVAEMKKYAKNAHTCDEFTNSYSDWKKLVEDEGKKQEFWEDKTGPKLIALLYALIGLGITIVSANYIYDFAWSHLTVIPSVIFAIYVIAFRKKTLKGINHYKRWKAFKKFLEEFGTFDTKELPEVILWERYMVYAVIFGVANKVQKAMNVKIKEMELNGTTIDTNTWVYHNMNMSHAINSSIASSINSAVSSAVAASASASASGSGGGFSGGGGFGGGGGGGHGF